MIRASHSWVLHILPGVSEDLLPSFVIPVIDVAHGIIRLFASLTTAGVPPLGRYLTLFYVLPFFKRHKGSPGDRDPPPDSKIILECVGNWRSDAAAGGIIRRDSAFALGRVGRTTIDGGGGQTEILELTLNA